MKNTKKDQLCSCIRISTDEFNDVVRKIYGHQVKVITDCDGIAVQVDEANYADDLLHRIALYYDLDEVTSVHIDDGDKPVVLIVYREKPKSWIVFNQGNGITVPITKTYSCPHCHHCQSKKSRFCPYCGHPMRS